MNTFPEKRARLRIPPPLCVGTLRKHAGGMFLVPTATAMPRGGNREGRGARFFAALRMTGRGTRPAGDEGRAEQSPAPTGPDLSRRGSSRGKHAVAPLKSRPRGARMNTFPEKRARLRIPPPLCVGTLRKHAGGMFLVPTATAMPRGGNREGRGARFFAALRMTGRGTRPAGDEGRAEQSPAPTGPDLSREGVIKGETRSCPLEIASARSADEHVSGETCAIENPTTALRWNVKKTCRGHVFSSDRNGYAARREPRGTRGEILRCAQNDRTGDATCGGRGTGGAEPRPYGS